MSIAQPVGGEMLKMRMIGTKVGAGISNLVPKKFKIPVPDLGISVMMSACIQIEYDSQKFSFLMADTGEIEKISGISVSIPCLDWFNVKDTYIPYILHMSGKTADLKIENYSISSNKSDFTMKVFTNDGDLFFALEKFNITTWGLMLGEFSFRGPIRLWSPKK